MTTPDSFVEVALTRGFVALVNEQDAELVLAHKWHAHKGKRTWYAARNLPRSTPRATQLMHTLIAGWPLVDHINGNGLDNRRTNLRAATTAANSANMRKCRGCSSSYKGVTWRKDTRRWMAYITVGGQRMYLGHHANEANAAHAYDDAARQHFGEFAALNFPQPGEQSALNQRAADSERRAGR